MLQVIVLVLALLPSLARAEARIALVITNQAYTQPGAQLSNTYRDGEVVKSALEKVGFKVWVVKDTTSEGALLQAIGEHVQRLAEAGPDAVGFLYYSGHGAADRPDGANFLIPTAAPLTHASQLPLMAVRLDRITQTLANSGRMSFVVFDACRNVPLQRETKDLSFKGFAPVREQNGLLVAFATEPGNIAVDQSVYANALAETLGKSGLEAGQVFRQVRQRVRRETGDKQSPEYLDRRERDFSFADASAHVAQPALASPSYAPGQSFRDCPSCPEMVVIPAGGFMMGSEDGNTDEKPVHKVSIAKNFAVGKYAVTFAEWDACVSDGGCSHKPDDRGWGRDRRPVINVSWYDATRQYLPWLSLKTGKIYHLLSEAEWEYSVRAGSNTAYSWGDQVGTNNTNCAGCGSQWDNKQTAPVGSFKPNAFGLYDMHGNVWQWVEDCHEVNYVGAPTDGSVQLSASCTHRVLRGGAWNYGSGSLRSAARFRYVPGDRGAIFGFRVARTL
jgi:formylglycine-generating enzyme required for sulfatase activity